MSVVAGRTTNPISGIESNLVKTHGASTYYGIWLKHLTLLHAGGHNGIPNVVAEIGPGATLGVGILALLCGSQSYFGLDLLRHTNVDDNIRLLDEVVALLARKAPAKNAVGGFPDYSNHLNSNHFPAAILSDDHLAVALAPARVEAIRKSIANGASGDDFNIQFHYIAPWENKNVHTALLGNVDLILSHSTMEHVSDIERAYKIFGTLIRPGGWMSHQIDFRSHGFSKPWNGYRTIGDLEWARLSGTAAYTINREPATRHHSLIMANGFAIGTLLSRLQENSVQRDKLAPRFATLSEYDMRCSGLFIQAMRI